MSQELDESLIAQLLDLPVSEQDAFLRRAAVDRPDLRAQLDQIRLVLAIPASSTRERSPAVPSSDADRARALSLAFGAQQTASAMIGPYKLLQKIGEGGFGTVWMAEQIGPVRRQVAVKVIKSGMDTREVIARFEAERQALAMMDHPNIARVFDAGETDAGRPYFVMELVRGVPVTRYCDQGRLPTPERLRLFIAVCHAVQHAHQKGIIHRDLKPSNIIVTLHDGRPVPKIIDFGIAKATGTQLTEKTLFTQFHAFMGTPAYTSPEQMEMSGLDVDTRSDIYSLGVLLYELLTGRPPFDPETLQKSGLDAMRQTIREVDPLRPSLCVGTLSAELRTAVARQRDTDPGKLSLLLRGDLDWIAMHCLEKDRARRYATAGDLAADVLRSLANEPIVARPPSSTYRLRKFVRRHRLGFIAGSAMAASVLAALVLSSVSLVRERAANRREAALRAEADANAAQARAAAERSAQTAQFMTAMLEGVGPSVALGRDTTMLREIVDRTARRLEVELRGQPEVSAGLRETLGVVYRDLGDYPTAEPLLREAAKTHRTIYGNESPQLAASLDLLGDVLRRLNQPEAAEQALQEALQIRRRLFGEQHPLFADTLFHLSLVRSPRRSPDEMESMVRQVLAIRRKNYPGEHPAIAEALSRLGTIARNKLEHEKAVELHTEAVAIQRKLLGNEHPAVADALDNLGFSLAHVGRRAESIAAYRETFFIRRKMLGDGHPQTAASLLFFLGQIPAAEAGEEIVSLVRDFIASQRQLLRPGAVALAPSLLALASLLDQPGRDPAAARAAVDEAMGLFAGARVRGPALDVDIIDAMALYGWWKFLSQVPAEGRTMSEEAITLAREAYGATSNGMVLPNHILAWLYLGMERKDEAVGQFEEAVRVDHAVLGPGHTFTGMDIAGLGAMYRETGRTTDARRVLEDALTVWSDVSVSGKSPPPSIAFVLDELGRTMIRQRQYAEAEKVLRDALRSYDGRTLQTIALHVRPRAQVSSALGVALAGQGKFAEAEPLVLEAYEELNASRATLAGDARGILRDALGAVITVYRGAGKTDQLSKWNAKLGELTAAQR